MSKEKPVKQKYKTGDLVQLKSGSPNLTVEGYRMPDESDELNHHIDGGVYLGCQWFDGAKLESGEFPEESLEPARA